MNFENVNDKITRIKKKYGKKINLFIIRRVDKPEIIEDISNYIYNKGYLIQYQLLIDIGNKKTFYQDFYSNKFKKYGKNILNDNRKQCYVIITNFIDKDKNDELKWKIREKYNSNIIHCSDSPDDANRELNLLLKENKKDFYHIGDTWSNPDYINDYLNDIEW